MIAGKLHAQDVIERKMLLASWLTEQPHVEANRVSKIFLRPETPGGGGPQIRVGRECQPVQILKNAAPFSLLTHGMTP